MRSLALSLRRRGMLYPLVVKPLKDGSYQLIAGERRLRAAREAGLKEVPVIERQANIDYELIEMGIENIQREDLSFYERGRWVAKMKEMGWLITSLAEETGIPQANLSNWLAFYEESERISSVTDEQFEPEKLPLEGLLGVKRAPIPEEKKVELAVEASRMAETPSVTEIQRAARLIEQEPELPAREAIERAKGITYLVPVPVDLAGKIRAQAESWGVSIQDAIVRILREYFG